MQGEPSSDHVVLATNSLSVRALRPCMMVRTVMNSFQSECRAQTYVAFCSVVSTAEANRRSVLDDLRVALAVELNGGAAAAAA